MEINMLDTLLTTLKHIDEVEYLITQTKTSRVESYNIKQQSEMAREVEVTQLMLTLYVVFEEDGQKYRGSYSTEIHPDTSEEELCKIIEQGVFAAGFVKNAYYPLAMPTPADRTTPQDIDIAKTLSDLQATFHAQNKQADIAGPIAPHLCYSEFFITRDDKRVINSNGVDITYTTYTGFIETAIHAPGSGKEIEICEAYNFSLDPATNKAMLEARLAKLFSTAAQKAIAKPTPQVGDINILLSGECLETFFSYYRSLANARLVYQQLSTFKEGTYVQGSNSCDRITLTLDPALPSSSLSRPYDDDGLPLTAHTIIQDGKLLKYSGDTRFASYLDIAPTGNIINMCVSGGTATDAQLKSEPYLELVSFSDFQVNPVTGDFGSEIRLGYYYDGTAIIPLTGGSISGNMANVHDTLRMSVSKAQYNNYHGPATISLRGATISGVN